MQIASRLSYCFLIFALALSLTTTSIATETSSTRTESKQESEPDQEEQESSSDESSQDEALENSEPQENEEAEMETGPELNGPEDQETQGDEGEMKEEAGNKENPDDDATPESQDEPEPENGEDDKEDESREVDESEDDDESEEDEPVAADQLLVNGSLEEASDDFPLGWMFPPMHKASGFKFKLDKENPFEGKVSGMLDSTEADTDKVPFTMLNQFINPKPIRGKRVRFRAAVRTGDRGADGKAQLWLRVDRKAKDGKPVMGAFDNMGDRPITSDEWKHHEIIVDIDDDAVRLTIGMLVLGKAKAWIDDVTFEEVSEDANTTGMALAGASGDEAPTQSFFTPWLLLVAFAVLLFILSQQKNSFIQRFALRFSIVYLILYSFPTVLTSLAEAILGVLEKFEVQVEPATTAIANFSTGFNTYAQQAVHWTAANIFGIEGQLVLPRGSGDTTYSHIRLFTLFAIALIVAIVWTSAYWRKADHRWLRDLLRTYLRYVLAITMLGYGLHKAGFIATQFGSGGTLSEWSLNRTFGDSSPMGLLWTFMAASPAYTFFAGLGEVIGGLLLVFRRTATLGAIVVFGVMLNVVMLNFCYDVPVKLYSFHLLVMACFLVLPEVPRLANVLFFNRPTQPNDLLTPPYTNKYTIWIHRAVKTLIVVCAFGWPVGEHLVKEFEHYRDGGLVEKSEARADSEHLLMNRGFRWINEVPYNR